MIKINFIGADGQTQVVAARCGESLLQCAIEHNIPGISGDCGGCASCGTCHAYIDEAWRPVVGDRNEDERLMLDGADGTQPGSRLICQIQLSEALNGLLVRVPAREA